MVGAGGVEEQQHVGASGAAAAEGCGGGRSRNMVASSPYCNFFSSILMLVMFQMQQQQAAGRTMALANGREQTDGRWPRSSMTFSLPHSPDHFKRGAARMKMSNRGVPGVPFDELVSSESHLMELGKCFFKPCLPERNPYEIRQELLRLRGRWDRIVELKYMEARIYELPVNPDHPKINFPQKQYEDHIKWYPEDAELLNKEIYNFGWMKIIWAGLSKGGASSKSNRSWQRAASAKGGASSKKLKDDDDDFMPSKRAQDRSKGRAAPARGGASSKKVNDDDDDFMPSKRAQNRPKSCASSKSSRSGKSAASSKGVDDDYDSADEFMPGKLVQVTFGRNREDLWRNHVSENSDDDFM